MSHSRFEPFFIDTTNGRLFALLRAPNGAKRSVLFVPSFGEEMNKCRRQTAETVARLVSAGVAVLVIDLYGTGDSDGEFGSATWSTWKENVASACSWMARNGLTLEGVVAIRLGCALAVEAFAQSHVQQMVFWQPVASGRQFMTQFLRLKVAASMMEGPRESIGALQARLDSGEALEIGGYTLSAELWNEVCQVDLPSALHSNIGGLAILETGARGTDELSVAGRRLLSAAHQRGINARGCRFAGDPFWNSVEIVVNPELSRLTVAYLTGRTA